MPVVASQRHRGQVLVADLDAQRVAATVQFGVDGQAGAGRGRPDQLDDHLVADQRPATPVDEIALNSRCSILFHLEVPGGKWHTVLSRPVSAASLASSVFHSRRR
jgi:hypothetical protein